MVTVTLFESFVVAGAASATSSWCQKVTTSEVSSVLGVKATKLFSQVNGNVTVCWYRVGANAQAAYVRIQMGDSKSGFNADRKAAGSATYGYTYSVIVLKKSTELALGAATSKLSNVDHLAKKILSLLRQSR